MILREKKSRNVGGRVTPGHGDILWLRRIMALQPLA
jgi:hypothetical protein